VSSFSSCFFIKKKLICLALTIVNEMQVLCCTIGSMHNTVSRLYMISMGGLESFDAFLCSITLLEDKIFIVLKKVYIEFTVTYVLFGPEFVA
jgi:hypothetical protein